MPGRQIRTACRNFHFAGYGVLSEITVMLVYYWVGRIVSAFLSNWHTYVYFESNELRSKPQIHSLNRASSLLSKRKMHDLVNNSLFDFKYQKRNIFVIFCCIKKRASSWKIIWYVRWRSLQTELIYQPTVNSLLEHFFVEIEKQEVAWKMTENNRTK